jgi:hypothetical protein
MSLQISEEYDRAYTLLLRTGLIRPDEDVDSRDPDSCAETRVKRGRYRLSLDALDSQYENRFTVCVRDLESGEEVLSISSPLKDARSDEIRETWSVSLAESVRSGEHPRVRDLLRGARLGEALLTGVELSTISILSEADLTDPNSKTMFTFVQMVFSWFGTLN